MIKKQFKFGLFTAIIGNLLWLGIVNVSADDTVIRDSPTVSALTKKVEAAKISAKAAAEEIGAETAAAAATAALARSRV
ncbi:CHAP domain-containing protein, partial [Streptococcus suis]